MALPFAQYLQTATDTVIHTKQATYLDTSISVSGWFAIIKVYIDLVRRALRAQTASMEVLASAISTSDLNGLGVVPLEKLTQQQRASLLDCAGRFMCLSLEELISEFSAASLSRQAVFPDGVPDIPPLIAIANALPSRSAKKIAPHRSLPANNIFRTRSQREVDRMMGVLRRRTTIDRNS